MYSRLQPLARVSYLSMRCHSSGTICCINYLYSRNYEEENANTIIFVQVGGGAVETTITYVLT